MSNTKFTEGEWEVTTLEGLEGTRILIESDDRVICDIFNINDIDIANANLMAASPLLYKALENVHKLVSEACATGCNPNDGDWADRLFKSQAQTSKALASARGDSHDT